jgi:hypothetical protein
LWANAPERLIAAVPGGMGIDLGSRGSPESIRTPLLLFRGNRPPDGSQSVPADVIANRALHGRFAYAVQWGAQHEIGLAPNIIMPMWWQAIARRYAPEQDPAAGPVTLAAVDEASGWLGAADWVANGAGLDLPTSPKAPEIAPYALFAGDRQKAVWLLDSYVAHVWRAYEALDDTIHITEPPRMFKGAGDSGLTLIEPGAKLPVKVEVGQTAAQVSSLDLFDGDLKLASAKAPDYRFDDLQLAVGLHTLIAVATLVDGVVQTSRPTVVLAIRGKCPPVSSGEPYPVKCVEAE